MSHFKKGRFLNPTTLLFFIGILILLTLWRSHIIDLPVFISLVIVSIPFRLNGTLIAFWGGENSTGSLLSVIGIYCKSYQHLWVITGISFYQQANYSINQFFGISFYCTAGENIFHFFTIACFNETRNTITGICSIHAFSKYGKQLHSFFSIN